jgi:hypothetical protein
MKKFDRPTEYLFEEAAKFLNPGSVIVEIGCIRDLKPAAKQTDGYSTQYWSNLNSEVHSVDTSMRAIQRAKFVVGDHHIIFHHEDGLKFLARFKKEIDLLYLDGPDADEHGKEFALNCFLTARLKQRSAVLVDDTDLPNNGKGEYVIPKTIEYGYRMIQGTRQVLLVRE